MADEKKRRRRRRNTSVEAEGRIVVSTQQLRARHILSEDQKEEVIEAVMFETDPAYIRIAHGVTKKIGEYESLRIDVAITLPCYQETIDQTASDLGDRVGKLMEAELDEYGIELYGNDNT